MNRKVRLATLAAFGVGSLGLIGSGCGSSDSTSSDTAGGDSGEKVLVGLITKTETNPFFVKMKEGAEAAATAAGLDFQAYAGEKDGDAAPQITAAQRLQAITANLNEMKAAAILDPSPENVTAFTSIAIRSAHISCIFSRGIRSRSTISLPKDSPSLR